MRYVRRELHCLNLSLGKRSHDLIALDLHEPRLQRLASLSGDDATDFTVHLLRFDEVAEGDLDWKEVLREFWRDFSGAVGGTKDIGIKEVIETLDQDLGQHFFPQTEGGTDPRGTSRLAMIDPCDGRWLFGDRPGLKPASGWYPVSM